MTHSTQRSPQSTPMQTRSQVSPTQVLQDKFNTFVNSLGDVLLDITALEVNTMVVSQITGNKFNPEAAYRELYEIPADLDDKFFFMKYGIPEVLHERYVALRRKLELHYKSSVDGFSSPKEGYLPNPDTEPKRLENLFNNSQFLRALRKLKELKAALDSDNPQSSKIDLIFAQTIIQLDGDIINRYHEKLLEHPKKEAIITIHHQGVTSGEKQWHGLLDFMVTLMQGILNPRGTKVVLLSRNGQKQS